MYGVTLGVGPTGQVSTGLGIATSQGALGLIAPTVDITHTGQEEVVDGVPIAFQLTPGTEAPSEMNFHFPQHRALCVAENATHNLHNLLTLRGALVRDPRIWAHYLNEAIELFGPETAIAFEPVRRVAERRGVDPAAAPLRFAVARDQTGALQHLQVLGDGRQGHLEGMGELADRGLAEGEAGQDGPPRRVGESGKGGAERVGHSSSGVVIINQLVK